MKKVVINGEDDNDDEDDDNDIEFLFSSLFQVVTTKAFSTKKVRDSNLIHVHPANASMAKPDVP